MQGEGNRAADPGVLTDLFGGDGPCTSTSLHSRYVPTHFSSLLLNQMRLSHLRRHLHLKPRWADYNFPRGSHSGHDRRQPSQLCSILSTTRRNFHPKDKTRATSDGRQNSFLVESHKVAVPFFPTPPNRKLTSTRGEPTALFALSLRATSTDSFRWRLLRFDPLA